MTEVVVIQMVGGGIGDRSGGNKMVGGSIGDRGGGNTDGRWWYR